VTVPASTPPATYFLIACADATKGVHESDEANNCRASATAVEILAPDLVVSAVSNPPPTANLSTSFAISDTTVNLGVVPAAESTTRYYLSVDAVYSSGDERIGARTVPTLAAATESTATVDVAIPGDVSLGSYYLIACADDREVVTETNEAQNCAAASTTIQITAPDLVISAVSPPPPTVAMGAGFTVTSTVENRGGGSSGATTTRHYLSTDALRNAGDRLLSGTLAAPGLAAGASFSGAVTVTTPVMTPGSYFVLACADDTSLGVESDESNNCTSSATQVTVAAPDLVVSALTNPPGIVNAGGSFAITETVQNQGNATAGASTARYYLSLDQIVNSGDRALTPTRSVPSLGAGTSSTGTATAVVSSSTPLGTYYLLACADDAAVVAEGSESNNCTASTTAVQVMGTDLVVSAMTEPPSSASLGGTFAITETVHNQGNGSAGTSTTRYYLSVDTNSGGDKRLSATRSVPSLAGGAASTGSVTLVVPTMSLGPYYLIACADDLKTVAEHNESNNCRTSTSTIQVTAPDLRIVALTEPPQAAVLGATFVATDTVENAGNGVAGSSTTRYYFSSDSIYNSGDKRLSATRAVPSLPGGGSLSAPITLAVPSMAVGTYYLLACADDTNSVVEVNEANNCFAAATTVQVTAPDLVVTMVGEPPPTATVSGSFTVSAAVQNVGNGAAAGSATRFYVSADAVYNSGDKRLNGDLNAPVLAPGSLSSGTRTVGIPSSTVPGTYFLLACADDTKVVTEGNESNNCRASTTRITISQ
jgi:subtilase family serine protease